MKLRDAIPINHRRGIAFVTRARGCGLEDVRTPVYAVTTEANALASLRLELGLGLHDAARRIGVRAIELSGLEHGRLVPEDPQDWKTAMQQLRKIARNGT